MKVTIAGASGFIGKNLIEALPQHLEIKAISRGHQSSGKSNVKWIQAELYSVNSTYNALMDTDVAIYLVHSMMPSSRLFQGDFADTDLLIADNFARGCIKNNVKQIIYVGGLVPEGKISKHLSSRKEVEDIFKSTGIPTTIFRAGMIVGNGGSSFEILKNLVLNLRGMILPKWTQSNTQVIYIQDLINLIKTSINNKDFFNRTLEAVNGEILTYEKVIRQTADYLDKKILFLNAPINSTSFSKLWVSIFGHSQYSLVSPLIDSLVCDLPRTKPDPLISNLIEYKTYKTMLTRISKQKVLKRSSKRVQSFDNTVRSIQRLENANNKNVSSISRLYVSWLPRFLNHVLKASYNGNFVTFSLLSKQLPLLKLELIKSEERDREKFHIVGGLLSKTENTGWFEFRQTAGGKYTLAAIHDYVPSLPWFIYRYSQAPFHKFVMKEFNTELNKSSDTD